MLPVIGAGPSSRLRIPWGRLRSPIVVVAGDGGRLACGFGDCCDRTIEHGSIVVDLLGSSPPVPRGLRG
jgi:hypothetical protein